MIRPLKIEDLPVVVNMEQQCFSSPWKYEQFLYELQENPYAHLAVVETDSIITGYLDYWLTFECCQLNKIAVAEDQRKQGYAREMMEYLIKEAIKADCEQIMLEVRFSNTAAQSLYKAYEFIEMNIRKGYYQDNGEDARIMVKALGGLSL